MKPDSADLLARRHRRLGPAYRLFYDEPLQIMRGEGVWLFDADGRRYLDMYNNVPHVGHCHPHVVEAVTRQMAVLNTHTRYLHPFVVDYAERLTACFEQPLDIAMFCCTGSEANELALRIARAQTGGTGVIVVQHAYHGNTQATFEVSTSEFPPERRPDHVVTVPAPDTYRGPHQGEDAGERYAQHVSAAIDLLDERGIIPAAFLVDTICSSSGVVKPPPGWLARVAEMVREAGMLFIADEVQPGFGRTGRHFWGYQADKFVPDIVTLGKPMGNGHPLAGVVTSKQALEAYVRDFDYFNTFGGNPVSCAAGLAVLDVLEQEGLQQNALEVGNYLSGALWKLADRHACIGDVRGNGFFIGVELVEDRESKAPATAFTHRVVNELRQLGLLTSSIGPHDNILKLRCPMVLTRKHAEHAVELMDRALGAVTA